MTITTSINRRKEFSARDRFSQPLTPAERQVTTRPPDSAQLPDTFSYERSEVFLLQIVAGNTAAILPGLGVMLVFLVLAALYESWLQPLAVILVVPLSLLAAIGGLVVAKLPIDILAQVGLVVLVGLASKNAILIVEFARQLRAAGHDARSATLTASRLRLRPILMTSLAFILGVFPLVVAQGEALSSAGRWGSPSSLA